MFCHKSAFSASKMQHLSYVSHMFVLLLKTNDMWFTCLSYVYSVSEHQLAINII